MALVGIKLEIMSHSGEKTGATSQWSLFLWNEEFFWCFCSLTFSDHTEYAK